MTSRPFSPLPALMAGLLSQVLCAAACLAEAGDTEATPPVLQEIVVSATRREERLQDVPISISAFSQEKMDAQGLRNIDDLTRLTPGVTFQRSGMSLSANYNDENSDINIRGIDSQAGTSTTGVYIDDTPIQSRHIGFGAVNAFPALFDLDRVEVLRGPQGTLFGAGAEGGAVRFISPQPGLQSASGYLRSELATTRGGDPSYEIAAAAGGPIIGDVLGFRISASFRRDGGYVDRVAYSHPGADPLTPPTYTGNVETDSNWQRTATLRAALRWQVNDAISITPSVYYQELHINDTGAYWVNLSNPGAGILRNGNALDNPSTDPFWLAAVKLDWNLGGARLTSNTSYYSRHQHSVSDYTQYWRATFLGNSYPAPGDAAPAPFDDTQSNFYQEVRLASTDSTARLTWNTGIFYSHLNENIAEDIYDPTLDAEFTAASGGFVSLCGASGILGAPCPNGLLLHNPINRVVDKQLAVFGEASFALTNTLKATVGLRVSKVDVNGETLNTAGALATQPGVLVHLAGQSEHPVTPKFVLGWQPDRDDLFYASVAKGYRVGGVNGQVSPICAGDLAAVGIPAGAAATGTVPQNYSSDSLWSYEIGAKNTVLNRRLQINSSLFIIDWSKIQQNVYLPDCGNQFVANLGKVRSHGGDIDVQARPIDSLTLGLTVAYTDAKFTKTSCASGLTFDGSACTGGTGTAPPIVTEGDRLVGAPWSVFTSAELAGPLAALAGRTGYLRVDYQVTTAQTAALAFQDNRNALFDNTIPGLPQTRNLALRAGLRWQGLDLSVFGQNLTNQQPLLFESRDIPPNLPTAAPDNLYFGRTPRPRTVGLTATYRY